MEDAGGSYERHEFLMLYKLRPVHPMRSWRQRLAHVVLHERLGADLRAVLVRADWTRDSPEGRGKGRVAAMTPRAEERLTKLMIDAQVDLIPDLAREAIALLREVQEAGYEHPIACETGCQCEWYDLGEKIDKWLGGK